MTVVTEPFISEKDFVDVWGARAKPNGDLYLYDEIVSLRQERVWTVAEGEDIDDGGFNLDGNWHSSPGIHVVNALGYVTTGRPWTEGTPDAAWYLDEGHERRSGGSY